MGYISVIWIILPLYGQFLHGDSELGVCLPVAAEEHAQEKNVREHLGAAGFHNELQLGKAALDKCAAWLDERIVAVR